MSVCSQCGHELDVGRFCVNCGHPIDAAPARDTPSFSEPRFPLYTDEVPASATGSHRQADHPTVDHPTVDHPTAGRPGRLPWLAAGAVLAVLAGVGVWLLLHGGDEPATTATDDRPAASTPTADPPGASPSATPEPGTDPGEVARQATVTVPATAPPNQDLDGNQVRYEGRNMLDGVPETCWRMPGDGSGSSLLLELAEPTTLSSVGLVNGYAKTAARDDGTSLDWYAGNRRVLAVEWVFDDGTVVRQDFEDTRVLQSIDIDPISTQTVELRLLSVSPPGRGASARDYTAISEVSLLGSPG